ncbi:MAG: hypothetical protein RDU20_09465 [Desulfomonilaceae bacterium]|nr:hypothetical protein [Desulfomonilaceae bacterium]
MARERTLHQDLEGHLLAKLAQHSSRNGLTYGELGKKCGGPWKRALAQARKISAKEARARDVKDFVYGLWERGLVFVEPPQGRQTSPRVWSPAAAAARFPLLTSDRTQPEPNTGASDHERLRDAYDGFAEERLSGHVPIYKVRRALGWPRDRFDRAVRDLNERPVPEIELHAGDPQNYREDEIADSFERRSVLYLLMRWRPA